MQNNNHGFTLIELLIALTISGLLVLASAQAYKIGLSYVEKGSDKFEENLRRLGVRKLVWKQISSLCAYQVNSDKFFFKGGPDQLMFISPFSLTGHYSTGFMIVSYRVVQNTEGDFQLTCREIPLQGEEFLKRLWQNEDDERFQQNTESITLFDKCQAISFEYFDKNPDKKEGSTWEKKWKKDYLPHAIRLEITVEKNVMVFLMPVVATS